MDVTVPQGVNSVLVGRSGRFAGATLFWALGVSALLAIPGGTEGLVTSHAVWMVGFLLAGLAAWHRSTVEPAARQGWRWIAAGSFSGLAYSAVQLLHLIAGTPAPGLTLTLLTVAPYPLFMVGILLWPAARRPQRLRAVLDAVIFAGSLFFLFWATGLGALVRDTRAAPVLVAANLVWFGGATLVLGMVAYTGGRSIERLYGPLGFLGAATLISMVCALFSTRLSLSGPYFPAHPIELVWLGAIGCLVLASLSPHPVNPLLGADRDPTTFAGDLMIYLPAGAVLVVSVVVGVVGDPVKIGLVMAIGTAVIGRQLLALHDGRQLANTLERKVAERTLQLQESQAALVRAERVQAFGQVAAGITHDFGNVLQVIYGQAEVLRRSTTDAKSRERLDHITRAAESGTEIIRSLLKIGPQGRGEPVELDLADAVHRLAWLFREAADRGIAVDLAGLMPARVLADRSQLEQVITNLVVNARDAMTGGGRLMVQTGLVTLTNGRPATWARLAVTDTGSGMTPEQVARIFEPFYTTKSAQKGTGLGLSTVYAIVAGLGGTINVESAPGAGSCFEVLMPAR